MKATTALRFGGIAAVLFTSVGVFADAVDNPGPVTFTVATGSSIAITKPDGTTFTVTFGGETPASTIGGTVAGDGTMTLPKASTTFQKKDLIVAGQKVTVQLVATADGSGSIDASPLGAGAASATMTLEVQLTSTDLPGFPASGCKIPATVLNLTTDSGVAYAAGKATLADNTFTALKSDGCSFYGPTIDDQLGLPIASGNGTITLALTSSPVLTGS